MEWFKNIFIKKGRRVALHIFLWLLLISFVLSSKIAKDNTLYSWNFILHFLFGFTSFIVLAYFNMYYLIPNYFKTKKYKTYAVYIISSIIVLHIISIVVMKNFDQEYIPRHHALHIFSYNIFINRLIASILVVIGTSFIYFVGQWIKLQDITINLKEADTQRVRAELQTLKAQINPHFLFNTLNNIYSFSLDKSDKTPEMILKLSGLMSYLLHESKAEKVSISQEINFIKNFIELEKLRFEDRLKLSYRDNLDSKSIIIAPLLFIPFIENAFKHGGNKRNKPIEIGVSFRYLNGMLLFNISNTFEEQDNRTTRKENGIGIENVKKRLLLLYPGKHQLHISQIKNKYVVELTLNVDANQMSDS